VLTSALLPVDEQGFPDSVFTRAAVTCSDDVQHDPQFAFELFHRFPRRRRLLPRVVGAGPAPKSANSGWGGREYSGGVARTALLLIAVALAGCAVPSLVTSPGPLQPLVVGTEQHVSLNWQPPASDLPTRVWGYINNQSPYTFYQIRVLVDALGPNDEILDQRLVWSPGALGSWGRNYFEAPMGPAHHYRARIYSWDRLEGDNQRRRPW
jgi:hypothetical protein